MIVHASLDLVNLRSESQGRTKAFLAKGNAGAVGRFGTTMRFDEVRAVVVLSDMRRRFDFGAAFVCSVALHGIVLLPLVMERRDAATINVVRVEIVMLADQTAEPEQASEARVGATTPAAGPLGGSPADAPRDEFESKLERLAKLRYPGPEVRLRDRPSPSPASDNAQSNVSDFIRAQVERRWSLDLAPLGNRTFSVLIRIEMTGAGVVTRADIVRDTRLAADKTYQDVARSARNAVLLSSPFVLPAGHYADLTELDLRLDTRDVLR